MKSSRITGWSRAVLFSLGLLATAAVGCQSTISGQTLPSAYYLDDDVQFHPAGQEDRLPILRRNLDDYRLRQQNVADGIDDEPFGP